MNSPQSLNSQIRNIALPAIATNITVPLLGLVDTAITGHLGAAAYIGAVAIGGMMFNMMYWLLGFLRMTTSGLTAQAYGGQQHEGLNAIRWQAMTYGAIAGLTIVLLQWPLHLLMQFFYAPEGEVSALASRYFFILVWGAPAVLTTNSLSGWFLGMQDARSPMITAISQNVVNIVLSLFFVLGLGMKIEGVALGTLLAQWSGLAVATACYFLRHHRSSTTVFWKLKLRGENRFFSVSRDIFLRTLCLVAVMSWFTREGAAFGEVTLAANTVLMQFFVITSYVFDGLANAAEAIGGKYYGAGETQALRRLLRKLISVCLLIAAVFVIVFAVAGTNIIALLTDSDVVRTEAATYLPYLVAVPVVSFVAFLLDGLFIGCTGTRAMLMSVALSAGVFFGLFYAMASSLHNHALWIAYLTYLLLRGVILACATPQLMKPMSTIRVGA